MLAWTGSSYPTIGTQESPAQSSYARFLEAMRSGEPTLSEPFNAQGEGYYFSLLSKLANIRGFTYAVRPADPRYGDYLVVTGLLSRIQHVTTVFSKSGESFRFETGLYSSMMLQRSLDKNPHPHTFVMRGLTEADGIPRVQTSSEFAPPPWVLVEEASKDFEESTRPLGDRYDYDYDETEGLLYSPYVCQKSTWLKTNLTSGLPVTTSLTVDLGIRPTNGQRSPILVGHMQNVVDDSTDPRAIFTRGFELLSAVFPDPEAVFGARES